MIYFDNAATSYPKPRFTLDAVGEAFRRYGANPGRGGHKMAIETSEMVFKAQVRSSLPCSAGRIPERVVFTQNCTGATNLATRGYCARGTM